jgi:energy-coupling factor transport system ATP-binding protein
MIELTHIGFSYGKKRALNDCSLTIGDGEITAITGENGSGKTTLGLLLAGMLSFQEGHIVVDGKDMGNGSTVEGFRRSIGIVFENPDNQFITTSVERELAFGLENLGVEPDNIRDRVENTIERFSLGAIRERQPHSLSGGEKQSVSIAATLIARPRYLILDEPTIFLDPVSREAVREIICSIKGEVTIIFISQFPSEILLADTIYELRDGCVRGPFDRASMFKLFRTYDPTIQFLQTLRDLGIFKGDTIPEIEALCAMIEARSEAG